MRLEFYFPSKSKYGDYLWDFYPETYARIRDLIESALINRFGGYSQHLVEGAYKVPARSIGDLGRTVFEDTTVYTVFVKPRFLERGTIIKDAGKILQRIKYPLKQDSVLLVVDNDPHFL